MTCRGSVEPARQWAAKAGAATINKDAQEWQETLSGDCRNISEAWRNRFVGKPPGPAQTSAK